MKKQLTLFGAIGVITSLAAGTRGAEQIATKLQATKLSNRLSAPRLEMPELADTPEIAIQKPKRRGGSAAGENARRSLQARLRAKKTKRVVAAQN